MATQSNKQAIYPMIGQTSANSNALDITDLCGLSGTPTATATQFKALTDMTGAATLVFDVNGTSLAIPVVLNS